MKDNTTSYWRLPSFLPVQGLGFRSGETQDDEGIETQNQCISQVLAEDKGHSKLPERRANCTASVEASRCSFELIAAFATPLVTNSVTAGAGWLQQLAAAALAAVNQLLKLVAVVTAPTWVTNPKLPLSQT